MSIILVVIQLFILAVIILLLRKRDVSPLLSIAILFYFIMWNATPVFIRVLLRDNISILEIVSYDTFILFALVENTALLIALLFLLFPAPYFRIITRDALVRVHIKPKVALLVIVTLIGLTWVYDKFLVGDVLGTTYVEWNAFATTAAGSEAFNYIGSSTIIKILLLSFVYACMLTSWPKGIPTRLLYVVSLVLVMYVTIEQVLFGARIYLLTPFVLLVLFARFKGWSKRKFLSLVGGMFVCLVFLGGIMTVVIGGLRAGGDIDINEVMSKGGDFIQDQESVGALMHAFQVEALTKFDSYSAGAVLVEQYGEGAAGWKPYLGTFVSLIPRTLWASKPVPGSVDGTYFGVPSRLVGFELTNDLFVSNVGVSPAAISIWQFGNFGLIILVLTNVMSLYFINSFLLSKYIIQRTLGLYMIGVPIFVTLFASPDYLLMNMQRVIVIYIFVEIVFRFLQFKPKNPIDDMAKAVS